ncbi:MAG TPA: hypothetical protein VGF45_02015, partial [Polyangia bacterium]
MYDARSFIGEVALDLHNSNSDADDAGHSFAIGIGGYYPLSRTNFTPYLGGSMAYAFADFGGYGANGLRVSPSIGFLFGRLSTVQIRGDLGYFFNTAGERSFVSSSVAPVAPASSEKKYAHGPHFSLGLGF